MKNKISLILFLFFITAISTTAFTAQVFAQSGEVPPEEPTTVPNSDLPPETAQTTSEPAPELAPQPEAGQPSAETSTPSATSPAPPRPTPKPVPPPIIVPTTTTPPMTIEETIPPIIPKNSSSNIIPIIIGALVLGIGGFFVLKAKKGNKNDPCGKLKKKRDAKKNELANVQNKISLEETLIEKLKEEVEDKKEKATEYLIKKGVGKIGNSALNKTVNLAQDAKNIYDNLSEKYEKAQNVLAILKTKQVKIYNELEALESACKKCMLQVASSATTLRGRKIGLFNNPTKIKYILVGGYVFKASDGGKAFCEELIKGFNKPVKILYCLFARPKEMWQEKFVNGKNFLLEHLSKEDFEIQLADVEKFTEQVKWANVIYLKGGETKSLLELLKRNTDWIDELEGKTFAGTSAGALAISKYYSGIFEVKSGLGLLNIKVIVHWKSDYRGPDVDWEDKYNKLKNYKENLPIYKLKEGEFIVL